jgi:hypothetical protein
VTRSGDLQKGQRTAAEKDQYAIRTEEVAVARGSSTQAKREREKTLQRQRQEKEAKRTLRKAEKASRASRPDGEDPDLVGLRWGPQEPLY